jgi:hypothetical protein
MRFAFPPYSRFGYSRFGAPQPLNVGCARAHHVRGEPKMGELSPEVKRVVHADKYRKSDPVQKCTEIIEAALKQYGCAYQVVMVPQITVIPKPKPKP